MLGEDWEMELTLEFTRAGGKGKENFSLQSLILKKVRRESKPQISSFCAIVGGSHFQVIVLPHVWIFFKG